MKYVLISHSKTILLNQYGKQLLQVSIVQININDISFQLFLKKWRYWKKRMSIGKKLMNIPKNVDYTDQQHKYTFPGTSKTLIILGRWFYDIKTLQCCQIGFSGGLLALKFFFSKFWFFWNFSLFIWKKNCQWFAKKVTKMPQTVSEILYKNIRNFATFLQFLKIFSVNINLSLKTNNYV